MISRLKSDLLLLAFGMLAFLAKGQAPTITAIDYDLNYPGENMVISGLNYSTDPSKMVVLFGGVKAEVISSDGANMVVKIPGNASASNIDIINTESRLSVSSPLKFYPSFHGSSFDIGEFSQELELTSFGQPYDVCACDLDGDGLRDMVTTKASDETNLAIYHNTTTDPTNIQFTATTNPVNIWSQNIACGDLNGDGKPEVLFGRRETGNANFVYVLANNSTPGSITFGSNTQLLMADGDEATKLAIYDLNFDGKPEIIVTNIKRNVISVYRNQSSGGSISFASTPVEIEVTGAETTRGIEVQDMDGDKKPELIITQFSGENIYILKNRSEVGTIDFDDAIEFELDKSIRNVKVGDFDLDGRADIVVTHTIETSMSIVLNKSTSSGLDFELAGNWPTNTEPWGVDLGDFDGDGDLDIIVSNNGFNSINIYENKWTSTSTSIDLSTWTINVAKKTRNVVVADMNNDAKPDVLFTSAARLDNGFYFLGVIRNAICFEPEIYGEATRYVCDQPIQLKAIHNPGAVFNWYKDGVLVQGPAHATNTVNQAFLETTDVGVYKIIVEAEGGACNLESNEITVVQESGSVPGAPTATNDGPGCEGTSIQLSVNFAGTPPAGITYSWSGPNGFTSTEESPVISNVVSEHVGEYTVVVASGNCVANETSTIVEVIELPPFSVTASTDVAFCSGGTASLQVTNRSGYSYQWFSDGAAISGATSTSFSATAAGLYSVEVTDNVSGCKTETNELELFIFEAPTAEIDVQSPLCLDQDIVFSAENSTTSGNATVYYQWDFGNGQTGTDIAPTTTYNSQGTFTVQLTVGYEEADCPATAVPVEVTINVPEELEIISSDDGVCGDSEVELTTNITVTNPIWSTAETTPSIIINEPANYSISGYDANGCTISAEIILPEKELPRLVVTATPEDGIINGEIISLNATGAEAYLWSPAETLDDPTVANPQGTPEETTMYYVEGTSADGCTALDSILVEVRPSISTDYKVLRPDGPNPILTIENKKDESSCTLTIFDRNGSKVFEGQGNTVDWDGTGNGGELPQGTYFYVFSCGETEPSTGSILLVRS